MESMLLCKCVNLPKLKFLVELRCFQILTEHSLTCSTHFKTILNCFVKVFCYRDLYDHIIRIDSVYRCLGQYLPINSVRSHLQLPLLRQTLPLNWLMFWRRTFTWLFCASLASLLLKLKVYWCFILLNLICSHFIWIVIK